MPIGNVFLSWAGQESVRLYTALRTRILVPNGPRPMHTVCSGNLQPKQGLHQRVPVHPLRCGSVILAPVDKALALLAPLELGAALLALLLPARRAPPGRTILHQDLQVVFNARTACPPRLDLNQRPIAFPFAALDLGPTLDEHHAMHALLEQPILNLSPSRKLLACLAMLDLFRNFLDSPNAQNALRARSVARNAPSAPSALKAR